jgi:hypothetical protein
LSTATIATVLERFGRLDLLFAMYASQNFEFFESQSPNFPFETHRENLENILKIRPRMVAPGSAGFRFCADHAWLNAFLFPISAERFLAHLARKPLRSGISTLKSRNYPAPAIRSKLLSRLLTITRVDKRQGRVFVCKFSYNESSLGSSKGNTRA